VLSRKSLLLPLCAGVISLLAGCSASQVDSISISPTSQSVAVGQTAQFTATGVTGHGTHPTSSSNVTNTVTWTSSVQAVASVSSTGVATGLSAGTTTITATMQGFSGAISSSATLTVTGAGTTTPGGTTIASITVIPGTQAVSAPGQTTQFLAIGVNSTGATQDLTTKVQWSSSSAQIASIGSNTGFATAVAQGTATITALYANASSGSVVTGTAAFTVSGGNTEQYTGLVLTPVAQSLSASGQTGQFVALGTSGTTGLQQDVTSSPQIKWTSSIPTIATVSSSGLAAGVSAGSTSVTAELTNPDGSIVSATATITVTLTPAPEPLLSLIIIPATITVGNLQDTGQFLAIGTYATSPTVRDLTNSVTWTSSVPNAFPVNTNGTGTPNPGADAGLATAFGTGVSVIIAEATDPTTGSIQTATAEFSCPLVLPDPALGVAGSCFPGSQASSLLSTVTVYNEGLNTTNWLVTAPSATGTPNVIHCGPGSSTQGLGDSVCVATYPVGFSPVLTVVPVGSTPAQFGGWSSTCETINPNPPSATGTNTCTVSATNAGSNLPTNQTVGVIFN